LDRVSIPAQRSVSGVRSRFGSVVGNPLSHIAKRQQPPPTGLYGFGFGSASEGQDLSPEKKALPDFKLERPRGKRRPSS
jgi:hypothetical protein